MTYILPGMGADSLMYGPAFRKLPNVKYINWPIYHGEKTISYVAERIIQEHNIKTNDIIGGSSLGGIVAAEISKQVAVKKLILIGSTLSPENINPILKKLSALTEITPLNMIQMFAGKINAVHESKLLKMFSESESRFIKAMCKAVFTWEGNKEPQCTVAHIHGAKDTIIYPPQHGAKIISDGGHLIAITNEQEVADFVRQNI